MAKTLDRRGRLVVVGMLVFGECPSLVQTALAARANMEGGHVGRQVDVRAQEGAKQHHESRAALVVRGRKPPTQTASEPSTRSPELNRVLRDVAMAMLWRHTKTCREHSETRAFYATLHSQSHMREVIL